MEKITKKEIIKIVNTTESPIVFIFDIVKTFEYSMFLEKKQSNINIIQNIPLDAIESWMNGFIDICSNTKMYLTFNCFLIFNIDDKDFILNKTISDNISSMNIKIYNIKKEK